MPEKTPINLSAKELHSWLQKESEKPLLVDVREKDELAIASLPFPVVHLPLSNAKGWISDLSEKLSKAQPIVVFCHSGIRSMDFAIWLLNQDWGYSVWNLEGGIDSWSRSVDSSIPRY